MPKPKKTREDLVKAASETWHDSDANTSYMATLFVQCSLPYRDPGDVPVWTRRNGGLTLMVQPGWVTSGTGETQSVGYPSGIMPRLLLNWMSTEAVRTGSPELELGSGLRAFMTKLNLKATGGKNGSIGKVRQQTERLFRARMSVHHDTPERQSGADLSIAHAWDLAWPARGDDSAQQSLMPSVVHLSPAFFQRVVDNPVAINMDALIALRGSALRIDIYTWVVFMMQGLKEAKEAVTISWEMLRGQFGSTLANDRSGRAQFKRDFTRNLIMVLKFYSEAKVEILDEGVRLYPSPPHLTERRIIAIGS